MSFRRFYGGRDDCDFAAKVAWAIAVTICACAIALVMLLPLRSSAQWVQTNGPYGGAVYALAVGGTDLFAGLGPGGVWRRPLSEMITSVKPHESELPQGISLSQNYPNPFNPSTTIRCGLPARSHVNLTVFNTLGQQVAVLQNGAEDAGYHNVKFDATNLSSGMYFYRLQACTFVETKRLVLVR